MLHDAFDDTNRREAVGGPHVDVGVHVGGRDDEALGVRRDAGDLGGVALVEPLVLVLEVVHLVWARERGGGKTHRM